MSKFHLHIVTPKGTYRDVDVDILNIRTTDGQMGILAHHMPLASGVEIAEMNYRIDKDRYEFAVGGGFVYVDGDNTVTLIVNDIESPEEIDLRRAEEAKARAEEGYYTYSCQKQLLRSRVNSLDFLLEIV